MTRLLDLNLEDVHEPELAPDGEYDIRLISVELKTSEKSGREYINALMAIEGENAPLVAHMIVLPDGEKPDMDERRKLDIKRFCTAFNLPLTLNFSEDGKMTGVKNLVARALVGTEQGTEGYDDRNRVKRWV